MSGEKRDVASGGDGADGAALAGGRPATRAALVLAAAVVSLAAGHVALVCYRPIGAWLSLRLQLVREFGRWLPRPHDASLVLMIGVALALTLVAALLLRRAGRSGAPLEPDSTGSADGSPPSTVRKTGGRPWLWLTGCGWLAATVWLVVELAAAPDGAAVVISWLVVQAAAVAVAWRVDRATGHRFGCPLGWRTAAVLAAATIAVAVLCAWDLGSWRYACIGDEWTHYNRAIDWSDDPVLQPGRIFPGIWAGVYGVHTPFESWTQAQIVRLAGADVVGWKLAGALFSALCLIPTYILARLFVGRSSAAVAAGVVGLSQYLIAEAHWGYGLGQPRTAAIWAVAMIVPVARGRSLAAAALAGIACGYATLLRAAAVVTMPLAVLLLVVMLSGRQPASGRRWLLVRPTRRRALLLVATVVLTWGLTAALPMSFYHPPEGHESTVHGLISKTSVGGLVAHYRGPEWTRHEPLTPAEFVRHTADMGFRSLVAPLYYESGSNYVWGRVFDPLSGALCSLGMIAAALSWRGPRRWPALWLVYLPWLLVIATLTPYGDLPITRMHFLVPLWAVFAGIGFELLRTGLARVAGSTTRVVSTLVAAVVIASVGVVNLLSFHAGWWPHQGLPPPALALRVAASSPDATVYLCGGRWGPFEPYDAYPEGRRIQVLAVEDILVDLPWRRFTASDVFLFNNVYFYECGDLLYRRFIAYYPGAEVTDVTDGPRHTRLLACRLPPAAVGRQPEPPPRPVLDPASSGPRASIADLPYVVSPICWEPRYGEDVNHRPIVVGGRQITDAYAAAPWRTSLFVMLPEGAERFEATAAIADNAGATPRDAAATFEVLVDGAPMTTLTELSPADGPVGVSVPVADGRVLELRTLAVRGEPRREVLPVWVEPGVVVGDSR